MEKEPEGEHEEASQNDANAAEEVHGDGGSELDQGGDEQATFDRWVGEQAQQLYTGGDVQAYKESIGRLLSGTRRPVRKRSIPLDPRRFEDESDFTEPSEADPIFVPIKGPRVGHSIDKLDTYEKLESSRMQGTFHVGNDENKA